MGSLSAADDASLCAAAFAVDPAGLGGVCLRSPVQPARTQWLDILRESLPAGTPVARVPFNIGDGRLFGGLDLTATLRAKRPVAERGALASADGGIVIVVMAERLSVHTAACLNLVLDAGEICLQREGVDIRDDARIGLVALDEGIGDDEQVPASLLDRLAFLIDLNGFDLRTPLAPVFDAAQISAARRLLPQVSAAPEVVEALCATGAALGAGSVRTSWLALRAARALAALEGRVQVTEEDATAAARMVLAPRATQVPRTDADLEPPVADSTSPPPADPANPAESNAAPPESTADSTSPEALSSEAPADTDASSGAPDPDDRPHASDPTLEDVVLAAARAAIPPGLLAGLRTGAIRSAAAAGAGGRAGALRAGGSRGRPSGVRAGMPRGHARLNVMETLRAAAPWQRLRGRLSPADRRVRIDASDFRLTRYKQRAQTLTIFAVDASGSSALNRLGEAKGAVELLLADCYVRRDQVAVVTFRGRAAELLLPPTRSLVRAKRALSGLPGGGGTPLASALDTSLLVATQAQRRGDTPILVILSDGRANVGRQGAGGRDAAQADALNAARRVGLARITALFVDTSPRPSAPAAVLAAAMNAEYIPLPFADARSLSRIVGRASSGVAR